MGISPVRRYPHRWAALLCGSLAVIVVALDTTILNVALPTLARDLHATSSELQWFADAYLLTLACVMLPAGFLSDRIGKRPAMLLALALFGAGSLACAFATSPRWLIAARVLLGFGAAAIFPLIFAVVVVLFAPDERGKAIGLVGACSIIGFPLGPILGGWILQHWSWHWVFWINVPVCLVAIVGVALFFPRDTAQRGRPVDVVGIVLSAAALSPLCYGLIEGPQRGWDDALVWGCLGGAAVLLVAFVAWEHRLGHDAVMDLSLWRNREFRWGSIAAALGNLLGFAGMFFLPQYLQLILGYDAIGSGLHMIPLVVSNVVGMLLGLGLASKIGTRIPLAAGLALLVAGSVVAARSTATSGFSHVVWWSVLFGVGFGFIAIIGQNAALERLPEDSAGAGSGVIQMIRQVGSVLGVALLPTVFSDTYRRHVDTGRLPQPLADVVRDSPQAGQIVAERLHNPALLASVRDAFVAGGAAEFWTAVGLAAIVGTVVVIAMPNVRINRGGGGHAG